MRESGPRGTCSELWGFRQFLKGVGSSKGHAGTLERDFVLGDAFSGLPSGNLGELRVAAAWVSAKNQAGQKGLLISELCSTGTQAKE